MLSRDGLARPPKIVAIWWSLFAASTALIVAARLGIDGAGLVASLLFLGLILFLTTPADPQASTATPGPPSSSVPLEREPHDIPKRNAILFGVGIWLYAALLLAFAAGWVNVRYLVAAAGLILIALNRVWADVYYLFPWRPWGDGDLRPLFRMIAIGGGIAVILTAVFGHFG